ncbi:MAG: hypothetical protein M5R40_29660 [Anaerolineae bacterium]|nr:hypothetical protein [Anaerolineae bacterium]
MAGYLVAQQPIERVTIIVAGVVGALLLLVSFYRMAWGLTMFVFVSLWVRFSLSTGTQSPLVASLLLAIALVVLWMLRMFLFEKRVALPPSRITVLLLLFGGVALLSFVWSNSFPDPMVVMNGMWPRSYNTRVATLMVVLASVGIALLTSRHFQEERWYRITVVMFVIAGFQGAVVSLGQALGVFSVQGIPILGT